MVFVFSSALVVFDCSFSVDGTYIATIFVYLVLILLYNHYVLSKKTDSNIKQGFNRPTDLKFTDGFFSVFCCEFSRYDVNKTSTF